MDNVDLVLEGGGVKGIGLVGAISALHAAGYECGGNARVAGTSAGALVGSLVAAGASVDELNTYLQTVDFSSFRDRTRFGRFGQAVSLLTRLGIYSGDWLHRWIADRLAEHKVTTFADLRITDDPDTALPPERAYRLVVVTSDVSRGRMLRLPWDFARYGLDPDEQPVADAVRASVSIPFFFRPVKLADARGGTPSYCTDGGMLSNFPIHLFDRHDGVPSRWPTFGIKLSAPPPQVEGPNGDPPIRGLLGLSRRLIGTMVEAHDRAYLDRASVRARTIFVDNAGVNATDFDLGKEQRELLFANGQSAARRFLKSWDFDDYQHTYG
jgi:NTE family protein